MTEPQIFSTEMMYYVGNGDESLCTYDFSILPVKLYERFFNGLPNMLYKKLTKVVFSADLLAEHNKNDSLSDRKLKAVIDSIAYKKENYLQYLLKILIELLPKSKTLKSLTLSSFDIEPRLLRKLFRAISESKTLECIHFKNIFTEDQDFEFLLENINPYKYKEVSFINCGLTSKSFDAITQFIQMKPFSRHLNKKLRVFNVSGCFYTSEELEQIQEMLEFIENDVTVTTVDTNSFNNQKSQKENEEEDSEPEVVNRDYQNSLSSLQSQSISTSEMGKVTVPRHRVRSLNQEQTEQTVHIRRTISNDIPDIDDLEDPESLSDSELRDQNDQLREIRDKLVAKLNGYVYDDDTILIGAEAKDIVDVMEDMKSKIYEYQRLNEV